jgi:hypothetical protein
MMKMLKTWKEEFIGLPLALLAFFILAEVVRYFDPTAGVYDTGVLLIIIYSLVRAMFFSWFAWLAIRWVFPVLWTFFQEEFVDAFNKLSEWQKIKISLLVFFAFFFSLVLLGVNP